MSLLALRPVMKRNTRESWDQSCILQAFISAPSPEQKKGKEKGYKHKATQIINCLGLTAALCLCIAIGDANIIATKVVTETTVATLWATSRYTFRSFGTCARGAFGVLSLDYCGQQWQ